MPRAKKHAKTGFLVGFVVATILSILRQLFEQDHNAENKVDWPKVIGWGLFGGIVSMFCSLLPDIFEPAYTPNHRGFFHSYTVLGLLAIAIFKIDQTTELDIPRKSLTFCAIVGYGSHLMLDSKTPAGLGLI